MSEPAIGALTVVLPEPVNVTPHGPSLIPPVPLIVNVPAFEPIVASLARVIGAETVLAPPRLTRAPLLDVPVPASEIVLVAGIVTPPAAGKASAPPLLTAIAVPPIAVLVPTTSVPALTLVVPL